jgi:2-C-methyl-D-erythritol 2,4-cyclodiphosphate synthase
MFRVGSGFDVHRFENTADENASVTLGGVSIPHTHRLLAHSDGDVLTHALCDALLGALALGDIGQHFPDSDARYKDINSLQLLSEVYGMLKKSGWSLQNADITLIAEKPKLADYREVIRQSLADCLQLPLNTISVKATTSEGLGFTGRGEGIVVQAQVLIQDVA